MVGQGPCFVTDRPLNLFRDYLRQAALMSIIIVRIICLVTKWLATLIALGAAIVAILFFYDLVTRDRWGYPWWLLAILICITVAAWALRRESALLLREVLKRGGYVEDETPLVAADD